VKLHALLRSLITVACAAGGVVAQPAAPDSSLRVEPGLAARRARYERPTREKIALLPAQALRLPFRLLNYPIEHYLIHKEPGAVTIYAGRALRGLRAEGVYLRVGGLGSGSAFGPGVRYEILPSARAPRLTLFAGTTYRGYDQIWARADSIRVGPARLEFRAQYDERPQEDFFGLGPDSRLEQRATFQHDELLLLARARVPLRGRWNALAQIDWSRNEVGRGRDPDFPSAPIAGDDRELTDFGASLVYDSRDVPEYARRGQFLHAMVLRTHDVYTKFTLEGAAFVPLPGWRRSLALRARAAVTDERSDAFIPVYRLERIGGSRTVRGYLTYRFQDLESVVGNVEYRFPIWSIDPPGGQALDGCAFFDFGSAVPDLRDLRQRDLRSAAGLGMRFVTARELVVRIDHARTPEGHRTHVGLRGTF
jgi:hypothetical protein